MSLEWTPEMIRKVREDMDKARVRLDTLEFAIAALRAASEAKARQRAAMKAKFPGLNWAKFEGIGY